MKKVLFAVLLLLNFSMTVYAENFEITIPCSGPSIETWRRVDEERVIQNHEYSSGLVARWYIEPGSEKVNGLTLSAFYKDGTEHLFRKIWTGKSGSAKIGDFMTSGQWLCSDLGSPLLPQKGFLLQELKDTLAMTSTLPENVKLKTIQYAVVTGMDENGKPIVSEKYKTIIMLNKNSVKDLTGSL